MSLLTWEALHSLWGWPVGAKKPWGSDPSSPSPDSLLQPILPFPPEAPSSLGCPANHRLRPLHPKPILAATLWLASATQVLLGARLGELQESLLWLDPCSLTSHVFYPCILGVQSTGCFIWARARGPSVLWASAPEQ